MKPQINHIAIRTMFIVTLAATIYIPLHTQAQQISFGKEYWYNEYSDVYGECMLQLSTQDYVLCGQDVGFFGPRIALLVIDTIGEIKSSCLIDFGISCRAETMTQFCDSIILLCGHMWNSNVDTGALFFQKRGLNGTVYFTKLYSNSNFGYAYDLQVIDNSFLIFCGQANYSNPFPHDGYLSKIDDSANIIWTALINDGIDTTHECINKVCQLTDGSFMATGWSRSNATMNLPYNLFVAHVSADGQVLNTRVYLPRYTGYSNTGYGICPTTDGNALVLSHEKPGPGLSWQICLYKITPQCDTLWTKFVPGPVGFGSGGNDMRNASDGGFLITGSAYLDYKPYAMIARLDSEGNQLWAEAHDNGNSMTFMVNVTETQDLGAAAIGYTYNSGDYHIYFLKTDTLGLVTGRQDVLPLSNDLHISPNPAKHSCRLQFMSGTHLIQLFDLQGRLVLNQNIKQGQTSADISLTHLPPGIYLIHLHSANNKQVKKLVKI